MATTSNQTTHGALLKELYSIPPVRAVNDASYLHDRVTKNPTPQVAFGGKYVRWDVTLQRALGRGSRADGGNLPFNISEVEGEAKAYIAQHYYALEWSEALEEVSKNKDGAFESFIARKMKNIGTDLAKELNRQWYNGANGVLAACPTNDAAGLTITVDTTQYIRAGDIIDIVTTATGVPITNGTARTVASFSRTNNTVTIDTNASVYGGGSGNVDTTGAESVVLTGNWGNEVVGLRAFADTGRTLHTINSSTYEEWDGNKVALSGTPVIGESRIEYLDDLIGRRGRGNPDVHLTTRGVRRRLADEFASQRRYINEKATDIKAGYKLVEIAGVETVIDDDCPKGYFFAGSLDALELMQMTQPGFIESEAGNGAYIELKNGSSAGSKQAVWQTFYRYHVALACKDPGQWGMITGGADEAY